MESKNENKILWYDDANIISNILIGLIIVIIVLSQSFAINNNLSSINIMRDIINHNINYILVLVYFIALKFKFGKKYFNYLNIFLIIFYFILSITSFLTIFQAFSIISLLGLAIKLIILVYLIHTMFMDTRYFKDLKINKSLFNDITNDGYFSSLVVLSSVLLGFNLVFVGSFDGAVLTILDSLYFILLGRFIFLYKEYLDFKTIVELKEDRKEEK